MFKILSDMQTGHSRSYEACIQTGRILCTVLVTRFVMQSVTFIPVEICQITRHRTLYRVNTLNRDEALRFTRSYGACLQTGRHLCTVLVTGFVMKSVAFIPVEICQITRHRTLYRVNTLNWDEALRYCRLILGMPTDWTPFMYSACNRICDAISNIHPG